MIGGTHCFEPWFDLDQEPPANHSYLRAMMDIAIKAESLGEPDNDQEEAWLLWVSARLDQVETFLALTESEYERHPQGQGVRVRRQRLGRVQFCDLLIEPGGIIPHHSHFDCNGVMRVLEGDLVSRNFDLVDQSARGITLQPTVTTQMTPGRTLTLSRCRDNVHEIIAGPSGARVLDVFTLFHEGAGCRYIDNICQPDQTGFIRACWQNEP